MAFIELKNCSKKYGSGSTVVWVNKNISFDINQGELVIIQVPQEQENQHY